jgi:hypothetical protein
MQNEMLLQILAENKLETAPLHLHEEKPAE